MEGQAWLKKNFAASVLDEWKAKYSVLVREDSPMPISPPPGLVIQETSSSPIHHPPPKRLRQAGHSLTSQLSRASGGSPVAGPSRLQPSLSGFPAVSRSHSGGSRVPALPFAEEGLDTWEPSGGDDSSSVWKRKRASTGSK